MSSLSLLRLPLNLPSLFISIRSIIYFCSFDLCRLYRSGFQFMLMIKMMRKGLREGYKRKDFFNITVFLSFHN